MKYTNANTVLPERLIQHIQHYIDGEIVYIPRKHENKKAWGEMNGTRKQLKKRNEAIYMSYLRGNTIQELMNEYFLSEKSISRIIREERNKEE